MANILILNPLFSCEENNIKGQRSILFDPDIDSFIEAIKFIETNNNEKHFIFMLVDAPPHIQSYPELFKNKNRVKKKNGVNGLRSLSQFNNEITDIYEKHSQNISLKDINVITTSSCYKELFKLSDNELINFPKCRITKRKSPFSCSSMAAIACKIATKNNAEDLYVFMNMKNKRTAPDIAIEGFHYAKENIIKNKLTIKII